MQEQEQSASTLAGRADSVQAGTAVLYSQSWYGVEICIKRWSSQCEGFKLMPVTAWHCQHQTQAINE
jgi:hypothetical protein